MNTRIQRKKLSYEVSEGILSIIESGKIALGDQLPTENALIAMFDVSRTSVREAVKSLAALGVLEIRPGKGTYVVGASPGPLRALPGRNRTANKDSLASLLEFRRIYEPEAAALSALRATPEEIEELHRCVVGLEKGVAAGIKPSEDLEFHLVVARATKNSALVDVSSLTARFYQDDTQLPDEIDVRGHREIYNAIKDHDPQAARAAMCAHIEEIERRYGEKDIFVDIDRKKQAQDPQ